MKLLKSVFKGLFVLFALAGNIVFASSSANYADLRPSDVRTRASEILSYHPSYKQVTPELAARILLTFCDELDPLKLYFLKEEVEEFLDPSNQSIAEVQNEFAEGHFELFEALLMKMDAAIVRRCSMEGRIDREILPKIGSFQCSDFEFLKTEEDLYKRWVFLRAAQMEAASKLGPQLCEAAMQRIQKRRSFFEQQRSLKDPEQFKHALATFLMKAFASSLDSQTVYYTPCEAKQLLIAMQQRLFGIGILMRDDADGFFVIKLVEGGPADRQKVLQVGDKIIAVNGEPVIGLDIVDVVELIRGEEGSTVTLKIIRRNISSGEETTVPQEVVLNRGEVVVKELRYNSKIEPFDDGVLVYLRLHSFYQDDETSSYQDLYSRLEELKLEQNVKGLILDLRSNPGGLLTQAVAVSGLFLDKSIVVSVKDDNDKLVHMRNYSTIKMWDGPLVVLINRASASSAEIVAQVLQDWGRAVVVGDDRSFGKGSYQLFSLSPDGVTPPNPKGEYKVTRGRYYTVSGRSPQLVGVQSDIVVPGSLAFARIGEQFSRFPLPADAIVPHYNDAFEDIPYFQRGVARSLYSKNRQYRLERFSRLLPQLKKNSEARLLKDAEYQSFLAKVQKLGDEVFIVSEDPQKERDFQLQEGWSVLMDMLSELGQVQSLRANPTCQK